MLIDRALLDIPTTRQRKTISKPDLEALKSSILSGVLLHAPIVQAVGGRYILVAGERRTRAIDLIHAMPARFVYNKEEILPPMIPVVLIDEAFDSLKRSELEYDENIIREEISWQDRTVALAYIFDLRKKANPNTTYRAVATQLVEEKAAPAAAPGKGSGVLTPDHVGKQLREAVIINKHLDDPAIAKARNATEAFNLIIKKEQDAFQAELILRGSRRETNVEVRRGSLLDILPKLEPGQFDLICADPPYGINVDTAGFRSRTVHHHNYGDSPDVARQLLSCILTEGFRICKPRANLFVFCDIDLFGWLKESAARAGWEPFRTPITWQKSDSEGMAPWGREGFRRTTEWIFFARKGQRGLIHSPIDVLRHNRVARDEREYGPEKPISLLKELISSACIPGDYILDPCCGSGSALAAARELNMRALGIELDEAAYNLALVKSQRDTLLEAL